MFSTSSIIEKGTNNTTIPCTRHSNNSTFITLSLNSCCQEKYLKSCTNIVKDDYLTFSVYIRFKATKQVNTMSYHVIYIYISK